MTHPRPAALGNRALLRIPEFRKLFVAQAISDIGDGMTFMALLLLVNALTHSTAAIAALSIAVAVPSMLGGIIAGAIADRFDRRRIMIASDTLRAALVLGFVVVGSLERLPILYVVAFVQASIGTLFTPARGALIPRVVPAEGLMAANGLGQMARMICNLGGTAVTGVLFATTGEAWPVFIVDAVTFVASAAIVTRVAAALGAPDPAEAHHRAGGLGASAVAGLRLIGASPTLLATVVGLAIAMLGLGAVNVLFVPFLINELGASAAWAGPLEAAQTISMVASAGMIGILAARVSAQSMMTGGLLGVGVMIMLLSVAPNAYALLGVLFIVGWFVTPAHAATMTIIQTTTTDAMRGRVLGALNATTSTSSILSTAAAGIFAGIIGIRGVFVAGGLICLGAALATAVLFWLDRRAVVAPATALEA
ncbi:MAG TPA: MFS transporter [Candidatus Limnocylindrales bacterium]|nr:MFS transporter [Candidatus Limnocylindrales bacterium]